MTLKFLAGLVALALISGVCQAQFRPPFRPPYRPPTVPPAQQPQQGNHPRTAPPPGSQTPNPQQQPTPNPQQPAPGRGGPPANYQGQAPNPQPQPPMGGFTPPGSRNQAPNQPLPWDDGQPGEFRNPPVQQPGPGPVVFEKRCSNCNHVVSSDSKVADTCPF